MNSRSMRMLDVRVVLEVPLRLFVPWLALVLVVAWAGYPGVACVTPLAWALALPVGRMCVARSRSREGSLRVLEAILAGALFGLLQGLLFLFMLPRLGEIIAGDKAAATFVSVAIIVIGPLAGGILSAFAAYLSQR